jgi:hypothetical protein
MTNRLQHLDGLLRRMAETWPKDGPKLDAAHIRDVTVAMRVLREELSLWDARVIDEAATAEAVASFYAALGDVASFGSFIARALDLARRDRKALDWITANAVRAIAAAPSKDAGLALRSAFESALERVTSPALAREILEAVRP